MLLSAMPVALDALGVRADGTKEILGLWIEPGLFSSPYASGYDNA